MLRKLPFIALCVFFPLFGSAQHSNDWINFTQTYFKVPVAKTGIYRLTYSDLQSAGFPVAAVDSRFIQLFHRGVEHSITVTGQADTHLDPADYIEFYGQANDGTLDAKLYQPSSLQPHSLYNLYSDTTSYFLTWAALPPAGKRMTTFFENNVTSIPIETSQNDQELTVYANQYSLGNTISNGEIENTFFDEGEGWTDTYICTQNSGCTGFRDYVIPNLSRGVVANGLPQLELLMVGRDELNHSTEIWVGQTSSSLRLLATQSFIDFQTMLVSSDLAWSDVGSDGKMTVEVRALGVGGFRDRISVSYIKVTFPQDFNFTGLTKKTIQLNVNGSGKSYIEITNAATSSRIWDITDVANPITIGSNFSGGILSAVVPNTNTQRQLFVSNEINTPAVKAVTFQHINPLQFDYLIVTHSSLESASQSYADYRSSTEGGGYFPIVVTMDQLYNQFNYGETSPLSVYEFVRFMVGEGSPKYLFLIGKGRDVSSNYTRHPSGFKDLVPSAGSPASDMAFSAGLNGSGYGPSIATGRISASTPTQVISYLNKVKETEAGSFNDLWRKKGLHLSGGIQLEPVNELVQFRNWLDGFKFYAERDYWGGKITTIAKHDATAVQQINISDQVNAGVNLITFFGHSSPGTIDIDIGKVTDPTLGYNNPGKYPAFLINGCNAGNFFSDGVSFGEDWMLASSRGARAFIAHSSFGFTFTLQQYSDLFYRVGFTDSTFIKQGIGDIQKEVARQYQLEYGTSMADVTQIQQMVLLGDPAVKLFGTATPDFATDDPSVSLESLDGKPVTALSDSFAIHVIVKDFGASRSGTLPVRLVRTFNDNSTVTYDSMFAAPKFQDTLVFKLYKGGANGSGNNRFTVTLDYTNKFNELNESNNVGTLNKVIPLGGTQNLVPFPYAIVNKTSFNLIFQSTDILSGTRSFQVEVDTVNTFNSAFLKHQVVSGKVLASLPVTLLATDSLVYYWRTKFDQPKANESTDWLVSSFTYINGSPEGWIQKKFGQFGENELEGIVLDLNSRELDFIETSASLYVKTFGENFAATNTDVSVKINNAEYNLATQGQPCRSNTINIIAFNKTSLVPYAALPFSFQDVRTCGREPQVINSFAASELQTGLGDDFAAMVDAIQTSDSVLIFSIGNAGYSVWPVGVKTKLHELGISDAQLSGLQDGDPLIALGRKGAPQGTATIFLATAAPANAQELQMADDITGRYTAGSMKSVTIGPASLWKELKPTAVGTQVSDVYQFNCYGVRLDGSKELLFANITGTIDLSGIEVETYPYLKLEMTSEDEINLDPAQLGKWLVIFDPVAEGVLLFDGPTEQQRVVEGQSWTSGQFKFVNISERSFSDSLAVHQEILSRKTLSQDISNFRIKAPAPGDTTRFTVYTSTDGKDGKNDVTIFVNRKILPEQFYENNVVDLGNYLLVQGDSLGPVLDVTIDGRYVTNGDFVSPDPTIVIRLRDENPFLFKSDTTGMSIILTYPCLSSDCPAQRIYFSLPDVTWYPATATSDFRVEFKPTDLEDGQYELFVQATDASGNKSGEDAYRVAFEVKNEFTFLFKSVYPNPSSSSFFFTFVLTGNVVPDDFSLQIYGVDGRILRSYDLSSVSGFFVGTNQLIWDPNDFAGSGLPSGLYLYNLRISVNGKEERNSGRLVLVR